MSNSRFAPPLSAFVPLLWAVGALTGLPSAAAAAQGAEPLERPPLDQARVAPAPDPFAGLFPGALPEETTPEAEQSWLAACAATVASGAERRRIEAFDIRFEVLTRNGAQTNNGEVRHRFLAPSYVRTRLESGKEQGRGPDGYWGRFEDERPERQVVRYDGREYAQDRWSIDQALAISRNFVALADPASLRILRLARLGEAPIDEVPPKLREEAHGLEWLELVSPDFGLPSREPTTREVKLYRVRIGVLRDSHALVLVSIQEERAAQRLTAEPLERGGEYEGYLIELREPRAVDGFMLPSRIFHHPYFVTKSPGSSVLRTRFAPDPEQEFYPLLAPGMLSPALTAQQFQPNG